MKRSSVRSGRRAWPLIALAAVMCVVVAPSAWAKGGGGVQIELGAAAGGAGTGGVFGIGGEGTLFLGPLRTGIELTGIRAGTATGLKGGFSGDIVLGHIANADLFLGAGFGFGGGDAFGGPAMYGRPEFGVQWNLGRAAVVAKLNATVAAPLAGQEPVTFVGLNLGMLFGDFPIGTVRGPGRHGPDRRPPPPPPPRRRPPPPPPPRY